jgi:hypothetical protein
VWWWCGQCWPEGAVEVSAVVVVVSAGRRGERSECGGGDGECGPEGASDVNVVVVVVSAGRKKRAR